MGRFFLVELHEDLEHLPVTARTSPTTPRSVWRSIRWVNGVKRVVDLQRISQETLDLILYKPPPPRIQRDARGRRWRQTELPG